MQKVTSSNLNGNAYQLEESGYETLREYLERAEQQLKDNPDRAEIMTDLEQAIADKCQRYLGPHKTVVTAAEVDRIVAEMGPVADTAPDEEHQPPDAGHATAKSSDAQEPSPRRLYRIMDGAMIAGVCNGLAAYLQIDVTIVRLAFVVSALITKGLGIFAYVGLMFVIPEARTAEARAAATGAPLNAREVVDRVKRQYVKGRKEWRRQWRQQRREWQRYGWAPGLPAAYVPHPVTAVLLPVFGLAHVALFLLMAAMMISLVNTGAILDWQLPQDVPIWAGAMILLVAYQIAVAPLRAVQYATAPPRPGLEPGWFAFWNAVTWLIGLAFVVWIAANHIPEIQEFVQQVPQLIRDFAADVREFVEQPRERPR